MSLHRREMKEWWRTQMWKWSILGTPHTTTSITPPWCPHGITVHLKSFWVILNCSLCATCPVFGHQRWLVSVSWSFIYWLLLLNRAGLGPFLWYMEPGLHSYWILPRNNTLPGECMVNENISTCELRRTSAGSKVTCTHFRPMTVKNIWPWWKECWVPYRHTCSRKQGKSIL